MSALAGQLRESTHIMAIRTAMLLLVGWNAVARRMMTLAFVRHNDLRIFDNLKLSTRKAIPS